MKKRQWLILLILGVFLAGLIVGYSLYSIYKNKKLAEEEAEKDTRISVHKLDKESINELTYTYDNEEVTLVKNGETWVEKDTGAPIIDDDVDAMISSASDIYANKVIVESTDEEYLLRFGLKPPMIEYTVKMTDGTDYHVAMGSKLISEDDAYYAILGDEEKIYSVTSDYYQPFEKKLPEITYVEDEIDIDPEKITGMEVTTPDMEFAAEYVGEGSKNTYYTWKITKPYTGIMADTDSLNNVLTAFASMQYKCCYAYNVASLEPYGLENPETVVRMTYHTGDDASDEMEYILNIGSQCTYKDYESYYVSPEGSNNVYILDSYDINGFMNFTPFSLADPCIYSVLVKDVKGFDIALDGKLYSVVRKEVPKTEEDDSKSDSKTKNEYYVNGKKVDENDLLTIYSLAYLLTYSGEADSDAGSGTGAETALKITYHPKEGEDVVVAYNTYDGNNFYRVDKNGMNYFLTDKRGVDEIITSVREFIKNNNL